MSEKTTCFVVSSSLNRDEEDVIAERINARKTIKNIFGKDTKITYQFEEDEDFGELKGLGFSIAMMSEANVIVLVPDCLKYNSCKIIYDIANKYQKEIFDLSDLK